MTNVLPLTRSSNLYRASPGLIVKDSFSRRALVRGSVPGATIAPNGTVVTDGTTVGNDFEQGVRDVCATPSAVSPNRLTFSPICLGMPGSAFWLRLVGWTVHGADPTTQVWEGSPFCVLYCVAGNLSGPAIVGGRTSADRARDSVRLVSELENFCDSVTLTSGRLGTGQYAGNVLAAGPGSPARVTVDLEGCQKVQFDFAHATRYNRVAMNALYRWA